MKIQIGSIRMEEVQLSETGKKSVYPFSNKTKKYLSPCLKEYGEEFISKFNSVFKVAMGIGDIVVGNRGFKHEKHLFILLNTKVATKFFTDFLKWIRDQSMYEGDYVFGDIRKSTHHMIIIKFPESHWGSFDTFKIGKYSEMFTKDVIDRFFEKHTQVKKVLIKDHDYKFYFVPKLNKKFGSSISPEEYEGELDHPPTEAGEVFNHHLKKK